MSNVAFCKRYVHAILALGVLGGFATVAAQGQPQAVYQPGRHDAITDVPGVTVGHYTHQASNVWRGVTVILLSDAGGLCATDERGRKSVTAATSCHAVVLAGGGSVGLASVAGVVDYLLEQGRGVPTQTRPVPLVPAAVIFDLSVGDGTVHPTAQWGYKAAAAAKGGAVEQGNVGAGTGGTMGKGPGGIRLKGGLGTASVVLPGGVVVGAVVVLNALGDVAHPSTGELYARTGGFDSLPARPSFAPHRESPESIENTTLVAVATNARLSKAQLVKVAEHAHDGLARSIRPVRTMLENNMVFSVSVGWDDRIEVETSLPEEEVDVIGSAAADVVMRAVIKGTEAATSVPGWRCYTEWRSEKARQERTIDDLRKLGHAWMAWQFDMMSAANPPKLPPHPTAEDLEAVLTPVYIQEIPTVDGWQNKLELTLSSQRTSVGVNSISIRSPGADGVFEEFPQEPKAFLPTDYDHDVVWQDGYLLTWPEGTRR